MTNTNRKSTLTPDDLRAAVAAGTIRRDLAEQAGVTLRRIYQIVGPEKVLLRLTPQQDNMIRSLHKKGFPQRKIAHKLRISRNTVQRHLPVERPANRPITAEEIAEMKRLRSSGRTIAETASMLDRSHTTVVKYGGTLRAQRSNYARNDLITRATI